MKNIIYVENEAFLRDVMKEMANQLGMQAYTYDASEELAFYLEDIKPDILIIDIDSVGERALSLIQSLDKFEFTPKIMVTGRSEALSAELNQLISSYIRKPFDPHQLLHQFKV